MAKFFLKTFGCAYNQADSEAMAAALSGAGHLPAAGAADADAVIVNTCSVKTPTENKAIDFIKRVEKPVLVTGCLAQATPATVERKAPRASILGIFAQPRVAQAFMETANGHKIKWMEKETAPRLSATVDGAVARVRISSGCVSACSFCQTRLARGRLQSHPVTEIRRTVEEAVAAGAKEIRLTAQDTGCYGMDSGSSLPELVEAVSSVPGDFMARVGMMNPGRAIELDGLVSALGRRKVFKFIHAPVQSGSDAVLADMKRDHSAADFEELVSRLRKRFPDAGVETDVIVGYPTETEGDFAETMELLKRVRPDMVNVSKFYPRLGTEAAGLKPLPSEVVKERSAACSRLCRAIALERHCALVGKRVRALVVEKASQRGGVAGALVVARTMQYYKVLARAEPGEWIDVKITSAGVCDLRGERI